MWNFLALSVALLLVNGMFIYEIVINGQFRYLDLLGFFLDIVHRPAFSNEG
jgi:hypothetical protein